MNVRRLRRRARRVWAAALERSGIPTRRFARSLRTAAGTPGERGHLLIAAPGAGNIGDQAMLEAFVAAADRPVTIVARSEDDYVLPRDLARRARVVALPHLLYGTGAEHRGDVRALGALLGDAATVSIIGADIMDGVYSLRPSVRRATIAEVAAGLGFDTSIIGFSWNGAAPAPARAALVRAGAAGTRLLLRDPDSAARVRALGAEGVVETADIVFTDERLAGALPAEVAELPRPFALVNASGLIARAVDHGIEYAGLVDDLRERGIHVVLVPHVLRDSADDRAACRAVREAVGPSGVTMVTGMLAPSVIRRIAADAEIVVTGRMHLAVMSLSQGVPAVTLASQGKVEGLMRLFEWPQLCVAPRAGMSGDIRAIVAAALDDPGSRARVRRGSQRARDRARANIDRIGAGGNGTPVGTDRSGGSTDGHAAT